MDVENWSGGGPAVAAAFRFKSNENDWVAVGALTFPTGTTMSVRAPLVFSTPPVSIQPWTRSPVAVMTVPDRSTWRFPLRV